MPLTSANPVDPSRDGRVVVVGAGLAGLTAARVLDASGRRVTVFDKGRSVGGRLATRRIGPATLDHGAQFFTVRSEPFAAQVDAAWEAGVVREWCRGFGPDADGHPRYMVAGGMNGLAKHLARDVDVRLDTTIAAIRPTTDGWRLEHANGATRTDELILTAPVPQSLALLAAGGATLDDAVTAQRLAAITYHPTLALMIVLDRPVTVGEVGAVQLAEGPFGFVADNRAKGVSAAPALTFHASHALSADLWDDDDATASLLEAALPWLGRAEVVEAQLKRWRYAQPTAPAAEPLVAATVDGRPVVFAGDAFAGSKVEGAFLSGRAAGLRLLGNAPWNRQ